MSCLEEEGRRPVLKRKRQDGLHGYLSRSQRMVVLSGISVQSQGGEQGGHQHTLRWGSSQGFWQGPSLPTHWLGVANLCPLACTLSDATGERDVDSCKGEEWGVFVSRKGKGCPSRVGGKGGGCLGPAKTWNWP